MFDRPPRPTDDRDDAPEPNVFRASAEPQQQRNHRPFQEIKIPTEKEILQTLIELNGSVALRLITPAEANAIRGNLQTVLDAQQKLQKTKTAGGSLEGLVELYKADPKVLDAVSGLLSDEQVEYVLRQCDPSAP